MERARRALNGDKGNTSEIDRLDRVDPEPSGKLHRFLHRLKSHGKEPEEKLDIDGEMDCFLPPSEAIQPSNSSREQEHTSSHNARHPDSPSSPLLLRLSEVQPPAYEDVVSSSNAASSLVLSSPSARRRSGLQLDGQLTRPPEPNSGDKSHSDNREET